MITRAVLRLASVPVLLVLASCAGGKAARNFAPVSAAQTQEALEAWINSARRASELPAARLLYDARMNDGGIATVPGTLAVSYDGADVRRASLTGPFGSTVAEYGAGRVTSEDGRSLALDPETLRSVLTATWPGAPAGVAGCDGADCLLIWNGPLQVSAIIDRTAQTVRELLIESPSTRLRVSYTGPMEPWPQRIAAHEDRSGKSLSLELVAVEAPGEPTAPR